MEGDPRLRGEAAVYAAKAGRRTLEREHGVIRSLNKETRPFLFFLARCSLGSCDLRIAKRRALQSLPRPRPKLSFRATSLRLLCCVGLECSIKCTQRLDGHQRIERATSHKERDAIGADFTAFYQLRSNVAQGEAQRLSWDVTVLYGKAFNLFERALKHEVSVAADK